MEFSAGPVLVSIDSRRATEMTQLSMGGKPTQVRIAGTLSPSILLVKPWPGLFGNTRALFSTLYVHTVRIMHVSL